MLTLHPLTNEQWFLIIAIGAALAAISFKFNAHIDAAADSDPLGSNSATYTVLGVSYTLVGAGAVLAIIFGWQVAGIILGVLFAAFADAVTDGELDSRLASRYLFPME